MCGYFYHCIFFNNNNNKKIIKHNKKKKIKSMTTFLGQLKVNSITLKSQALIDMEISQEEFITILKEKDKYEKIKENVRNAIEKLEEKQENIQLKSVNSRSQKNKWVNR